MDALTRAATVGTSREALPAGGLPTDDLLGGAEKSPERTLLLRAGMRAVYRDAGRRAETGVEAPMPAPAETLLACSSKAAEILRRLLAGRREDVLSEALERLRHAGLRLPHALLPAALDVHQKELRPAVAAVLGERGRWLARQNPAWGWGVASAGSEADDETDWEEGASTERLAALRGVRGRDAETGLRWVEEVWKSEKADARVEMVAALETGLSSGDEPFLERALDDRSVRVREAAVALLARNPGSTYAERAAARAGSVLVRYEPPATGLLRRHRAGKLVVEPPEDVDGGWRRDLPGVEKAPRGTGGKAWRISRSLAVVPPDHWEDRFGASPEELVAAAKGNEWASAVLAGWCRADALHNDPGWALPLWECCYGLPDDTEWSHAWAVAQELAPVLPQDGIARSLPGLLQGRSVKMSGRLASTLRAIPALWTPGLSGVYVERLRAHLEALAAHPPAGGGDHWVHTLARAAVALSPEVMEAATGMDDVLQDLRGEEGWFVRWFGGELRKFDETLEVRRRLVKEIPL